MSSPVEELMDAVVAAQAATKRRQATWDEMNRQQGIAGLAAHEYALAVKAEGVAYAALNDHVRGERYCSKCDRTVRDGGHECLEHGSVAFS